MDVVDIEGSKETGVVEGRFYLCHGWLYPHIPVLCSQRTKLPLAQELVPWCSERSCEGPYSLKDSQWLW